MMAHALTQAYARPRPLVHTPADDLAGLIQSGALAGDLITMDARYQLSDTTGVLRFIGLEGGFWIGGRHQQSHIGL